MSTNFSCTLGVGIPVSLSDFYHFDGELNYIDCPDHPHAQDGKVNFCPKCGKDLCEEEEWVESDKIEVSARLNDTYQHAGEESFEFFEELCELLKQQAGLTVLHAKVGRQKGQMYLGLSLASEGRMVSGLTEESVSVGQFREYLDTLEEGLGILNMEYEEEDIDLLLLGSVV